MTPEKRRSFFSLLFVTAMDNFGQAIVVVMFTAFLLSGNYDFLPPETSVATRNLYLGILFATFPLTQFFGAPLLGDIGDRAGRKKALILTILGTVVGVLLSGVACLFSNIYFLIFSRLLTGFFAGNLSICMAAIADLSPGEKARSRNFGLVTVVWGITWNIAMLVGGYLSDPTKSKFFTPALPFWITACITLLSLFAIWKWYHETHPTTQKHPFNLIKGMHNIGTSLKVKEVRPYFLVILFWTLGWGLGMQWFGSYSILKFHSSQEIISWGFLIQGCFWMVGGSAINPLLIRKYPTLSTAIFGYLFVIVFLVFAALSHQYAWFLILYSLSATFSSFAFSNSMNLASIHAPEKIQGKIMGFSQSMMSFGFFLVPFVGAYIGGKDINLFYPLAAALLIVSLALLLIQRKKHR